MVLTLMERHAIFFLDMDIIIIRYHAQNGNATYLLHHLSAAVEETHVAAEFVDDDALDEPSVFFCLQGDAAIDGSEHSSTVDIAYEDHVGLRMTRHRQVHQVGVAQVDLGDASSSLHHDGIKPLGQTVEGPAYLSTEVDVFIEVRGTRYVGRE